MSETVCSDFSVTSVPLCFQKSRLNSLRNASLFVVKH